MTTARPATAPAAPPRPSTTRAITNTALSGATAQANDATANRPVPPRRMDRRPTESLSGPTRI